MSQSLSHVQTVVPTTNQQHSETAAGIDAVVQHAGDVKPVTTSDSGKSPLIGKDTLATSKIHERDDNAHAPLTFPNLEASIPHGAVFVAVQEWEGYVIEIKQDDFVARLLDITGKAKREEEEATISFEEIADTDRDTMQLGSIFRWVIGYEHTSGGIKRNVSQIVFRDLPVVTQTDWDDAYEWALETRRLLGL